MRLAKTCVLCASAILVVSLGACGVPVDRSPAVLSKAAIPFHLLAPAPQPRNTQTFGSHSEVPVSVYLVSASGRLVPVVRQVASDQQAVVSALDALVDGPTLNESSQGLFSAIPPQTTVLGVIVDNGLATVDLGGTFGQLVGVSQVQAVAQIVFTAMSAPGADMTGIAFELSDHAVEVPIESGSQVPVVNEADFATLSPLPFPHSSPP